MAILLYLFSAKFRTAIDAFSKTKNNLKLLIMCRDMQKLFDNREFQKKLLFHKHNVKENLNIFGIPCICSTYVPIYKIIIICDKRVKFSTQVLFIQFTRKLRVRDVHFTDIIITGLFIGWRSVNASLEIVNSIGPTTIRNGHWPFFSAFKFAR